MLAEPRWFFDNNTRTMVINLIGFNNTEVMSRTGISTVQTAMGETNYTSFSPVTGPLCIVYTPSSVQEQDYSVAWDNYFMKYFNNPPDISVSRIGSPDTQAQLTYTVSFNKPITLVVKKYEVIIKSL
jgi:hypothetical protein